MRKIVMHAITGLPVETHIRREHNEILFRYQSLCLPDRGTHFDPILPSLVVTGNYYVSPDTDTLVSEFWITHNFTACIKTITVYVGKKLL
jgi:L-rhamnose isomerase